MPPEALKQVGRYDVLEVIGRGGTAIVYLALQRDLRRRVALKQLAPLQAEDPMFAGRFIEESRVAASLSHPNIVTVHEYFEHDGLPYIAMEYLPRGSLRAYAGRLTTAQIAGVLEAVLAGLSHGRSQHVVHRDLKPENLLVTGDGRVKIADFGIARAYTDALTRQVVTVTGTTIGTPAYMAPEQALGHEVGHQADLYSLGIIAWELIAGRGPYDAVSTPVAVLYQQVHEPVPAVRTVDPDVDPRLDAWLEGMLAKEPGNRYPDADAAWDALEDVVIEMLGPRWRREARLPVGEETEAVERPLTPATFSKPSDEPTPGATEAVPTPPLVPAEPEPDRATVHRLARRHAGREERPVAPAPVARRRPWPLIGALAAAAVVAAVIGVLLGASGGGRAKPPAPVVSPDAPLARVLGTVAATRARGLAQLDAARTPAAQAQAAEVVMSAYAGGATQVASMPVTVRDSPAGRSIAASLHATSGAYGMLADAARRGSASAYAAAATQVADDERALRTQAARL